MSDVIFNLAVIAIAVVMARVIALRGMFFALLTFCGLLFATFVTLRFWSRATGLLTGVLPLNEPGVQLTAFLILLTLSLQPLLIASHRLANTKLPDYPQVLETLGRVVFGTVSSVIIVCLAATTLTLMQPVGLRQYDPSRWWWPADTAIVRLYQQVERLLAPNSPPTRLPALSAPSEPITPQAS